MNNFKSMQTLLRCPCCLSTALLWSIENFSVAFIVRSSLRKLTKSFVRLTFSWIKYFDLLFVNNLAAVDGASCVYVFGRKINGRISDAEIIAQYVAAQRLRYT